MSRILLIYIELRHGGIETLILRLANFFAGSGRTTALCATAGELADQIDERVDQLPSTNRPDAVRQAVEWIGRSAEPVTMISFDPISAALGLAVEGRNAGRVPLLHLSGVYHPRTFFMTGERRDRVLLNRLVARAVGDPLIFYMNAECLAEHERRWRTPLATSAIVPLPIEERAAAWQPVNRDPLRIVSVGRLVDFKTYNLAAPEIVRECGDAGIPVSWDIYGTGPLSDRIRESINRHDVGQAVVLKGILPYASYSRTIAGYDLFVGMGTAALEAAMLGVPTIVATESEPRRSYGFVDQLPFGNVGERQSFPPPHDIGELIRDFAAMDQSERSALSARCREAVMPYSLDNCLAAIDRLAAAGIAPPGLAFKRAVSRLYEGLTASPAAELARRVKARLGR